MKIGNLEVYGVIYKITNKVNGKVYIGQTVRCFKERYYYNGEGIERVYKHHLSRKINKSQYNKHLLSSIEKYGFNNFKVDEVLDVAFTQKELDTKEITYIKLYRSTDKTFGYNKKDGGSKGKATIETRERISMSLKGNVTGERHHMYGKHHSDETKKKISEAKKGKYTKEESPSFGRVGELNGKSIKVQCVNTGEIFESANIASKKYRCDRSSIIKNCKGKRKTAGRLIDGTSLKWKYI